MSSTNNLMVDTTKPINGIYLVKTRQCKSCLLWKPLSNFTTVNKVKNKKNSNCKECKKEINRKYYEKYRKPLFTKREQQREEKRKRLEEAEKEKATNNDDKGKEDNNKIDNASNADEIKEQNNNL